MDQQRLDYLLEKHHRNNLSAHEQLELDAWYDELDDPEFKPKYIAGTPEAQAYVEDHTRKIMRRIATGKRNRLLSLWLRIAAVLILGLFVSYLFWPARQQNNKEFAAEAIASASYNRYFTLADSSTVILGEGSSLQLADGFGKENRNLTLKGEAYFDVQHNASLPFVIQTGKIKTTVLGTAFNIKQVADSVAVTVTRGKVRVETEGKILAVLTPGKQLNANLREQIAELGETELASSVAWMQHGLMFNNTTLAEVVIQLQQRYGVNIELKTPGMEHCRVNIVAPLTGTESLYTVLDVICTMLGAHYVQTDSKIELTGQVCMKE